MRFTGGRVRRSLSGEENRAIFSSKAEENVYLWQRAKWPQLRWNDGRLISPLAEARLAQGRLLGGMERLGFDLRRVAEVEAQTDSLVKSSEIEADVLDRAAVRSSMARHLGLRHAAQVRADKRTEGLVEMTLDATTSLGAPLSPARLFAWQSALFRAGPSAIAPVRAGKWRSRSGDPMQVVSGPVGRQRVHFEAPPAALVAAEMKRFLVWFNGERSEDGLLRAGLAHLWFLTIHPFEDGNGRIARALTDRALAQAEGSERRFYSLSTQIRKERSAYYDALESAQKGDLDVTEWLLWFLGCFTRAVAGTEAISSRVIRKADFWQRWQGEALSERQRKVLNRVLDGFEGKLTARKWAALGKCSVPTAQRDINDLLECGALRKNEGGSKNTSYSLGS